MFFLMKAWCWDVAFLGFARLNQKKSKIFYLVASQPKFSEKPTTIFWSFKIPTKSEISVHNQFLKNACRCTTTGAKDTSFIFCGETVSCLVHSLSEIYDSNTKSYKPKSKSSFIWIYYHVFKGFYLVHILAGTVTPAKQRNLFYCCFPLPHSCLKKFKRKWKRSKRLSWASGFISAWI